MLNGNMHINGDAVTMANRLKNNNGLLIQNSFTDQYLDRFVYYIL